MGRSRLAQLVLNRKLVQAVDELYFAADNRGEGEIDKAIQVINCGAEMCDSFSD